MVIIEGGQIVKLTIEIDKEYYNDIINRNPNLDSDTLLSELVSYIDKGIPFENLEKNMIIISDEEVRSMIDKKLDKIIRTNYEEMIRKTLSETICSIFDLRRDAFLYDTIELILNKELKKHIEEEFEKKDYFSDERLKEVAENIANNITSNLNRSILDSIGCRLYNRDEDEDED